MYRKAKSEFEKIGWSEQANQIDNSISYYQEKLEKDKNLRIFDYFSESDKPLRHVLVPVLRTIHQFIKAIFVPNITY